MNYQVSYKDYEFFLFMMIMELACNKGESSVLFTVFAFCYVVLAGSDLYKRIRTLKKENN